jgi:hypothetical protein
MGRIRRSNALLDRCAAQATRMAKAETGKQAGKSGDAQQGGNRRSDLIPDRDVYEPAGTRKVSNQRFCWSEAVWWAWEDLNLRPHPYQQSRAYRCATLRFCRSRATVRGEVMRCSKGVSEGRLRPSSSPVAGVHTTPDATVSSLPR